MKRKGGESKAGLMCSREECSKWRYLAVKDHSLVRVYDDWEYDDWECNDSHAERYEESGAPGQWWDKWI